MTNRVPHMAIAYAIEEERNMWQASGTVRAGDQACTVGYALDRLARNLAIQIHTAARAEFLQRAGVTS